MPYYQTSCGYPREDAIKDDGAWETRVDSGIVENKRYHSTGRMWG